jgi:hypothetical protein
MIAIAAASALLGAVLSAQPEAYPSRPRPLPFPPPGTLPLEYRVVTQRDSLSGAELPLALDGQSPSLSPVIQDRMEIRTEDEYRAALGEASEGIDWSEYRVLVVQDLTVYKLGRIESTVSLAGIYRSDYAIYIGRSYSQYGPVQGIAQLSEWFGYRYRSLFILLPSEPGPIYYIDIGLEDVPTDIP